MGDFWDSIGNVNEENTQLKKRVMNVETLLIGSSRGKTVEEI